MGLSAEDMALRDPGSRGLPRAPGGPSTLLYYTIHKDIHGVRGGGAGGGGIVVANLIGSAVAPGEMGPMVTANSNIRGGG